MRIITDNAVDRAASVAATNETALLPASNIAIEGKTRILRTSANTTVITIAWAVAESIRGIALPWTNLTAVATWRVQIYSDQAATAQIYDSGTTSTGIFPGPAIRNLPASANSFAFGGYATCAHWTPTLHSARAMKITLTDTLLSFIDVARVVAGNYWQPAYNPDAGALFMVEDMGSGDRSESGDARRRLGPRFRKARLDIGMMQATDRAELWTIARACGTVSPVFMSVLPGNAIDAAEENMMQLYAHFATPPVLNAQHYNAYSTSMEFEEM